MPVRGGRKISPTNLNDPSADTMSVKSSKTAVTNATMATSKSAKSSKSDTVNYLLLYENMVRHQDLEFDATANHIKLTIERIQYLGRKKSSAGDIGAVGMNIGGVCMNVGGVGGGNEMEEETDVPEGMVTYLQMRRCLLRLGYTWNRSLPSTSQTSAYYDDDVSVASVISGSSGSQSSGFSATRDIIATDAQLIMLLTTLVEMEERYRANKVSRATETEDGSNDVEDENDVLHSQGLFVPEFIQAYKLIIGGMQSLLSIPSPEDSTATESFGMSGKKLSAEELAALRTRARERTLGIIRLFGPDSKLYKNDTSDGLGVGNQSAGEAPRQQKDSMAPSRSNKQRSIPSVSSASKLSSSANTSTSRSASHSKQAKDGLLPRLNEDEIRKLVHTKDAALAKILEEHESEMNVMASNMEEMKRKELHAQNVLKAKRKRMKMAAMLGVAFIITLLLGGVIWEFRRENQRREEVEREIRLGMEEERRIDAEKISMLKAEITALKTKLSDAEATIRYEEGRYESIHQSFSESKQELEEMEVKWLVDQGDLERCRIKEKELDVDLKRVSDRNEELEEEVGWCRERLGSAERNLDAMARELKMMKSSKLIGGVSFGSGSETLGSEGSDEEAAGNMDKNKDTSGDDGSDDSNATSTTTIAKSKKVGKKTKPVQLEMKFNKSFRNAVMLRQTYSAIGGMVASVLFQGLFPGIGKVIMLFFT